MSVSKELQNRKRKLDDSENEEKEEAKRIFIESLEPKPELLDLADELLMEIAYRLDGESLFNISE